MAFDALRTNNVPALDNAAAYADFLHGGERHRPRARAVAAAAAPAAPPVIPPPLLTAGDRIEVCWGNIFYAGRFTSSRADRSANVRLHRIVYDTIGGWRSEAHWHNLDDEEWRRA